MINLGQYSINNENHDVPLQEGSFGSFIKDTMEVDTKEIKQAWQDASDGIDADGNEITDGRTHVLSTVDRNLSKGAKNASAIDRMVGKHTVSTKSIIARARNSVLQFPVYVPQTIRVNEAHIIGKMFERVYATLVQAVLAQNPIMTEEEANNLVFLKKFHTNIQEAADVLVNKYYEPIDELDRIMQESIFYEQQITENCRVRFSVVPTTDEYLIKENARLINEPLAGLAYLYEAKTEDSKDENREQSTTILTEKDLKEMAIDRAKLSSTERRYFDMSITDINNEIKNAFPDMDASELGRLNRQRIYDKRNAEDKVHDELEKLKEDIKAGNVKNCSYVGGQYRRTNVKVSTKTSSKTSSGDERAKPAVDAPKLLKDSDIKKQNGLLPYTIEAMFMIKTANGLEREVRYIIGVKTVMHLFRTQDLAEDLKELVMGKVKTLQKVRYKTGEISFKDYFLNLKGLKSDASKHINYNKRWINTLKRLADYRDMNGSVMKGHISAITNGSVPIPNGTLVLSQPDVVNLTNQTGIDLSIVSNAKRLARSMFLIAIVIVDSSAGTMRVLFPDNDNEWDVQSLASIDSELAKTDNSQLMKELNRMVNK